MLAKKQTKEEFWAMIKDWAEEKQLVFPDQVPPYFQFLNPREGWPPLKFEVTSEFSTREDFEGEVDRLYPIRALYYPEKAKKAAARGNGHYWHGSRGPVTGEGSRSPHTAPVTTADNLAWTWQHRMHKWATIHSGVSIDDRLDIYLTCFDGVRKFDLAGKLLWETVTIPSQLTDSPCLYKGAIYGSLTTGEVFAMDIEDGSWIWLTKVSYAVSQDNGFVNVGEDVLVAGVDEHPNMGSGSNRVVGMAVADGTLLWSYRPDETCWNFGAGYPGDGTVVFQDWAGKAYRISLKDGSEIWKGGGIPNTWTDGTMSLGPSAFGPEPVVYTVGTGAGQGGLKFGAVGWVTAHRLKDGKVLWRTKVPEPPNNAPAIGPLEPGGPLRVVIPCGAQCVHDNPTIIDVLDAKDGALLWRFNGPKLAAREPFQPTFQAADPQGIEERLKHGCRDQSAPNPWGAPSIGGDGTIYCGNQDGQVYSIRQSNKPVKNSFKYRGNWEGVVQVGPDQSAEVWAFECFACFGGPAGAAIAPGVLVVDSIDTMFVYVDPSVYSKKAEASSSQASAPKAKDASAAWARAMLGE